MGDVFQIAADIAERLDGVGGLRAFGYARDAVAPPTAVVYPASGVYGATMGRGSDDLTFIVQLYVSKGWTRTGQDLLAAYLDGSGATSIIAALTDSPDPAPSAAGAHFYEVSGFDRVGIHDLAGVGYLGAQLTVEVTASGTT